MKVGLTVDLAIPMGFAFAVGAVRVAAIRSGRIRLAEHESLSGRAPGGHTIERHIGKTPEELLARLSRRPELREASSFRNIREAEQLVSKVLSDNSNQIQLWVKNVHPALKIARMQLLRTFANQTGTVIRRGSQTAIPCYKVRVVLDFKKWHGKPYFILTAFPEV